MRAGRISRLGFALRAILVLALNSGGHVVYLAPGARFSEDAMTAFVSVGVPIITGQNGLQDGPAVRLIAGGSWRL